LVYVDDLITSNDFANISSLKQALRRQFEMTDIATTTNYLGTEIENHNSGLFIHQCSYILQLFKHFGMKDCNSAKLPMDTKQQLCKDIGISPTDQHTYRSLVGSLLYATNTRPNISYVVSCVSHYMDQPQQAHYQAAKHILRYLKGTMNYAIFFHRTIPMTYIHLLTQTGVVISTLVAQLLASYIN